MFLNWFLVGAGAWLLAVGLKIALDLAFQRTASFDLPVWLAAIFSGVWSTLCELGLAAVAFLVWRATVWDAIAFALGTAMMELFMLLPAALAGRIDKKPDPKSPLRVLTWRNFAIERALALAGHIGSRVLVWAGIAGGGGLGALGAAFGFYAVSEALAAYGEAKEWNWLSPRVMWPFMIFQSIIVIATIAVAVYYLQTSPAAMVPQ